MESCTKYRPDFKLHQESVIKKFLRNLGCAVSCVQFLHHHFSSRLKFIPPSPFSQSVYSMLSIVPPLSYYSLSVSSSIISSAFCVRTSPHVFLRVSSCTSLTVDISPGHRIPRCLHIPSCLNILGCTYTNVHAEVTDPQCVLNDSLDCLAL